MPDNTPLRGYTFPTSDDPNDLSFITQRFLEQIEADVEALDTGPTWLPLTIATGWAIIHATVAPEYAIIHDEVRLRGSIIRAAGMSTSYSIALSGLPPATVNDGMYPVMDGGLGQLGSANVPGGSAAGNIRNDGVLRLAARVAVASNAVVTLNGMTYKRAV